MHKPFDRIPCLEGDRILVKRIEETDADAVDRLRNSSEVYRYLPTFLYEQSIRDIHTVIYGMYDKLFLEKESLHLGIYWKKNMEFCGIAEFYGYRSEILKISLGYRLLKEWWGQGIATETVGLLVDYLYGQTDIQIITASTMVENVASAKVLRKNGFDLVISGVEEDWGYPALTLSDKWIL